eukprot:maker-scaffold247_size239117-snap-gene-1.20 protein:Tk09330 transcript:maker-scaffold247_size239117-snap-gene-1.20-mRNA-1 annotation:"hypothetical protein"
MKPLTLVFVAALATTAYGSPVDASDLLTGLASFSQASKWANTLWERVAGNDCAKVVVPAGHGAVLFTGKDCKGDRYDVPFGAQNIPKAQRERHESAVVDKDCALYLYDESWGRTTSKIKNVFRSSSNKNVKKILDLGDYAILLAPKDQPLALNLKNKNDKTENNLSKDSEFAAVAKGTQGPCPPVPAHVAVQAYPKDNCDLGGWDQPFQLPITDGKTYELDDEDEGEEDEIECLVIRKGCTVIVADTATFSNDGEATITASSDKDLVVNLGSSTLPNVKSLNNDINTMQASCPGETEINVFPDPS